MKRLSVTALVAASACLAAATLQAQVADLRGWNETPGLYFYLIQPPSAWQEGFMTGEHRPVPDRVSGKAGVLLTFKAEPEPAKVDAMEVVSSAPVAEKPPAVFVYRPPAAVFTARDGWAGFCLWVKGNGTEGVGVIGIGEGAPNDPRVMFSLREKTWQPVRVRWEEFNPAFRSTSVPSLFFTVTFGTKRPASFIVGRLELIRAVGPAVEDDALRAMGAKTAKEPEVERPKDLSPFAGGGDVLAGVRAKIEGKSPVRVLVLGDAVAAGASLWSIPPAARSRALFPGLLDAALKARDPAASVVTVIVDGPESASGPLLAALRPSAPNAARPDVVVLEFSCSAPGIPLGAGANAKKATQALLELCHASGVPVIALPVPALKDDFKRVDYGTVLFDAATAAKVPTISFGAFAAARGKDYEGEYYAAADALNPQGHAAAAQLLQSVLVKP